MIVTVRLEADGKTLHEVVKDIEAATKSLKLPKNMHVHDEHYERVHASCYKGRRVFRIGEKPSTAWPPQQFVGTAVTSPNNVTVRNVPATRNQ